jgi:hypothetical protein
VRVKDGVKTYSDKPLQVKGKGGISISGKDYSRDKGGTGFASPVITPESLGTVPPPPKVPPLPVNDPGPIVDTNNAALAPGLAAMGVTYDSKGGFQTKPPTETATPSGGFTMSDLIQQKMAALSGVEPPSGERLYNEAYRESGKRQAERDVNT